MKKLTPRIHGILDYFTVVVLAISPSFLEMENHGREISYLLAIVHMNLTMLTNFRAGIFKIIPLRIHGRIELLVSVGLAGMAIWFRELGAPVSFSYYLVISAAVFVIWFASDYRPDPRPLTGENS